MRSGSQTTQAGNPATLTHYMREIPQREEAREATSERPLTITNKVGLHARPAALFVQTAARFKDTKVEVIKDGTVRDAKSMLGVLTLGVSQGTTITVRADGPHADEAIAALTDLVDRDFGE
jgi:phosphocarrier protein HPr